MLREISFKSWAVLSVGLVAGLALGGAMSLGVWLGASESGNNRMFNELKLKAAATHGSDTFAIATGQIDEETEGLFTLDFVTGDLNCFVLNSRNPTAMAGRFMINVNDPKIFGAKRGKKPNFLITTGSFQGGASTGGARPAQSICYVADANSGEVAAFGFPWNRAVTSSGGVQGTPMIMMGKWSARNADLRQ